MHKKRKSTLLLLALLVLITIPTALAFSSLKSGIVGKSKNFLETDSSTKYDIIADLDGGSFEMNSKPEFTKMDNGNWIHKYKPVATETTLPTPIKDGYEFIGWSVNDNPDIIKDFVISKWHNKNLNIKANWKALNSTLTTGIDFNTKIKAIPEFKNVTNVIFETNKNINNGIDVSEKQNKSIKAYVNGNTLHIATPGNIIFINPNATDMFREMTNLTSIDFSNLNTSKLTNLDSFLRGCSNLNTAIGLENFNTENVTNFRHLFEDNKFTELNLSNWKTNNLTNLSSTFKNCTKLTNLNINNWNTIYVTDMNNTFENCLSLTNLDLTNWKLDNTNTMNRMFINCENLTYIGNTLNWNTSKVTNMDRTFYNCKSITKLNISNWNTSNVTNLNGTFENCNKLTELNVSNWNTSNVTSMDRTFAECYAVQELDVSNWNTSKVTDLTRTFWDCRVIKKLDCSKWDTSKVTNMDRTFCDVNNATEINVSGWNTSACTNFHRMFANAHNVINLDTTTFDTSNAIDMAYIFAGCHKITNLDLTNFNTINNKRFTGMFLDCYELKSLKIPNFDFTNATGTQYMFGDCHNLSGEVVINTIIPETMPEGTDPSDSEYWGIKYMFHQCSNLSGKFIVKYTSPETKEMGRKMVATKTSGCEVYLYEPEATLLDGPTFNKTISNMPNFANVTEIKFVKETPNSNGINVAKEGEAKAYIEENILKIACDSKIYANTNIETMFNGLNNISKITFDNFDTSKTTNMRLLFNDCEKLTNIIGLDKFDTSNVTNMSGLFRTCSSLTSVDLTNFNTNKVTTIDSMFMSCTNLTNVNISSFNTSNMTDISKLFTDCNKLNNVDLSNFNTSNVTNMGNMFTGCFELTNINLSNFDTSKVTNMSFMFSECNKLNNLNISKFNTSNVTNMSYMFDNCYALTNLDLSHFNTSNVTNMKSMFYYCNLLTNINIDNWDTTNVTDMSGMFYNCNKLSGEITIRNTNTKYKGIHEDDKMFAYCSLDNNTKFIVKYKDAATKETARNMVNTKNPDNHVYLYEPISVKYKFNISDGSTIPTEIRNLLPIDNNIYLIYENNKVTIKNPSKTSITIGNNKYTFQSYDKTNGFTITENMLKTDSNGNKYIEIIGTWKKEQTLPIIDGNTLIPGPEFNRKLRVGQDEYYHMYFKRVSSMSGISGIDVSAAQNKSIIAYQPTPDTYYIVSTKTILANKNASDMFDTTYRELLTLDLTNFDIGQSENISGLFNGQSSLRTITNIENMHTYHVKDMSELFYDCSSLQSLDLRKWNTNNVTNMLGTFAVCGVSNLNVSNWNTENVINMRCTFMNLPNLRTLDLSSWKTPKVKTFRSMFDRCNNISTVYGNLVMKEPDECPWVAEDCPNINLKVTVTESYNSNRYWDVYDGMFVNSGRNGRITIDYTSNARTLAEEIKSDAQNNGCPNTYLGSQVTAPYSLNTFNVFKINPNKKQINDEYKIREYLKNNNELLNKYEMGKMSEQEINEINEKINNENIINIIEDKMNKLLIVKAN